MYELTTARLGLKRMTPDEAPVFLTLNADPEVVKYTGDGPFADEAAARAFLERYQEVYQNEGYGRFSVYWLETGECVGWCGLRYQTELGLPDLGYRLFRHWWGRGIATEAGAASLDYGFRTLGLARIVARAMSENVGSIRVMQKLGMRYWREDVFEAHPAVLYEMDAAVWEKARENFFSKTLK